MARSALDSLVQLATVEVTQAAADGLITAQINTGISTAATYGWMLQRVEFSFSTLTAIPLATDQDITVQFAKGSQSALLEFDSEDLIAEFKLTLPTIAGSVGNPVIYLPWAWEAPDNFVVANPIITCLLDSTGTGLSLVGRGRIFYFPVALSEMDLLRLLAQ